MSEESGFGFQIDRLILRGGSTIDLLAPGVTAIVGGNNVGKSTLLREALSAAATTGQRGSGVLVEEAQTTKSGTSDQFKAWVAKHNPGSLSSGNLDFWPDQPEYFPNLLMFLANAQERLNSTGPVQMRPDVSVPAGTPLHHMEDDRAFFNSLNAISVRVFNQPLTFDDVSLNLLLRVGVPDAPPSAFGESKGAYRAALASLPALHQQGDGMKSLMGLLLPLMTMAYPVILVDEPEAFLHPPQAYALGDILGELSKTSNTQIVVATHDRSFLAGLLNSEAPLSVVRLSRDGNHTTAHQLHAETLRELWSDAALRYSNVLDGLFHRLVVLAEADRDCRFYQATLDALPEPEGEASSLVKSDVLFVPTNGKSGMARLVEALRAVAVRVVASPDLDVLNDERVIRGLVESLGGNWGDYARNYSVATAGFRQSRDPATMGTVRASVDRWFKARIDEHGENEAWTSKTREGLSSELRARESPWAAVKDHGQSAFRGEAAKAASTLLADLDDLGAVCVRVGVLENFAPELGIAKGPRWLPGALAAGVHKHDRARAHIRRIIERS
jgi:predicted ATPase